MTFLVTMYQTEPHLNLHRSEYEHHAFDQQVLIRSNQFDYSIHNCRCQRARIGLIFYPNDEQMKNIILLVCTQCYNYQLENGSAHSQLENWYFNIYRDSTSFHCKSRFMQNEDRSFCFYSASSNTNELFNITERELDDWEKDIIQKMVQKKQR